MANTRELRRRIRSVKNTSQITKAMQMVAATKMRRAQAQALLGRPYIENLTLALSELSGKINTELHPLLRENKTDSVGLLLLTTDKGLCGALNTNLFRLTQSFISEKRNVQVFTIGKKGRQFVVRTSRDLKADFENPEIVTFRQASLSAKLLIDAFLLGELKEVYLIYPHFISTLRQEPTLRKILPVDSTMLSPASSSSEFIFEPDPDTLLDFVLTHSVEARIYSALLETKASEHSARMMAMQNATDNAKELVEDLSLEYNQTRQQAITNELLEITTAQAALE
ncbi:ATP synthase F1 subunit gamma [Candidatus Daviesbacteria bacterium]|nr:ATP synthase F1 subunit gamma [Candidatus Daviesbacteria bacterium]